ncbi:hypothetical protein ACP4OV_017310 [Aristida adscensionis]
MAVALSLLLVLLFRSSPVARAADGQDEYYTVAAMTSLKPEAECAGHRVAPPNNRTWLPLSITHGPCSEKLWNGSTPSMDDVLEQDELRVDGIQRRLADKLSKKERRLQSPGVGGSQADGPAPVKGSVMKYTKGFHPSVKGGVGSRRRRRRSRTQQLAAAGGDDLLPGVVQTLLLDTASDVGWVQCAPCPVPPCYPPANTIYDPTQSPTYAPVACNSPICARLGPYANGCVNNQCQYRVVYPDGSSTSGAYISDGLTLNPARRIRSFLFGCSHVERGGFDPEADGILGLGGGSESVVAQTEASYGSAFSYCVPPTLDTKGFFVLGVPSYAAASRYVLTPMLRDSPAAPPTLYRVRLRAITVAGQRVGVPPAVFAAGAVLDTRTVLTRLPRTAYLALRAAFRSSMRAYRAAPPRGVLDTCYDFRGVGTVRLPRVELVFDQNAVVELDASGVLFNDCLAFVPNTDDRKTGVIGNVQQRTIEVLYNVGAGTVGFRRGAC